MESLRSYYDTLVDTVRHCNWVVQEQLSFRPIDERSAYIKGELFLHGGYVLHVAEFVSQQDEVTEAEKYRYHLQDAHQRRIARWDNAPHYPGLPGFPHHVHRQDNHVEAAEPMTLHCLLEKKLDTVLKDI